MVRIGKDIYEERVVVGIGSLELDRPLRMDHPVGTPVIRIPHDRFRASRQPQQFSMDADDSEDDDLTSSRSRTTKAKKFEYKTPKLPPLPSCLLYTSDAADE